MMKEKMVTTSSETAASSISKELSRLHRDRRIYLWCSILAAATWAMRLSYGDHSTNTKMYLPMAFLFLFNSANIGSIRLRKHIAAFSPLPLEEHISLLLESMHYIAARRDAASKLLPLLPVLPLEEARKVEKKLWLRLYRYCSKHPSEGYPDGFEIAARLADNIHGADAADK